MSPQEIEKNNQLVFIEWMDAIENLSGWHTEEEALEWADEDDWIVHQVGWIMKETEDYVLLCTRCNEARGERKANYGGLFKIPKPWIRYRVELSIRTP